ncbi:SGNH hydrolase-type esterase domain-containing protein [Podospora aff. communis PSN243]|uniref:SGNH hydrolase-type esterase domain-containing protein n=1 Tax=Podospora aff. communis PSN243 TaxID=3040156 RepID=A0AAV9H393_9PEZI|nr:SGNH hydrolase-type esterase domain-containing protein [Podospora aff. communis PSN243]
MLSPSRLALAAIAVLSGSAFVDSTILQNGQVRITDFKNTAVDRSTLSLRTYPRNATEISYQGRWDSNYVSWWSAPGLKFGYTGSQVGITFGPSTSPGVLIGYRISGLDWHFTNVTGGQTHMLVEPRTPGVDLTAPINPTTFEMRVTNWAYGVQIEAVHVGEGQKLIKLPDAPRRIEVIGDSLAAGMYTSYEGLSSWAYGVGAGLGNTDYSITAYPGICAADQDCWGNPRGQVHQWFYTSDMMSRDPDVFADIPEPWDFSKHPAADLVIINIGTNDQNSHNNVSAPVYIDALAKIVQGVHGKYPNAQVIVMSLWLGFSQTGNTYASVSYKGFVNEVRDMIKMFNSDEYLSNPVIYDGVTKKISQTNKKTKPFVHLFNTTGILQHNDIAPQWHPTDVGAIKVASHLLQFIKMTFGWELQATGPEVFHETLYWNDEPNY